MMQSCKDGKDVRNITSTSTGPGPSNKTTDSGNPSVSDARKTSHDYERPVQCDRKSLSTIMTECWLKIAITLPVNMNIIECTAPPDVLWTIPAHGDSANTIQLQKETETKKEKMKRYYAVAKQNAFE